MPGVVVGWEAPGAGPGAVATWDSSILYNGHSSFVLYVQRKVALPLGVTVFCQFKVTNTKSPFASTERSASSSPSAPATLRYPSP